MEAVKRNIDEHIDITSKINLVNKALDYGEVEVIVSNSGTDRHGERIIMEGIDTSQVKRNPVVLWAHDYQNLPIGSITKIWKSGGNLMARLKFANDIYEFADHVYKMILNGFISAVSIGGIVKEWAEDMVTIKKMEMVELSVVPVGAHPDALVVSKSLGIKADEFRKDYQEFLYKGLLDKMGKLPEDEVKSNIKALKNLTSALESAYSDSADSETSNEPIEVKRIKIIKRLVIARQAAKQCDKQSELIIAAISKKLNS